MYIYIYILLRSVSRVVGSSKVVCSDWVPPMSNEVPLFVHCYWIMKIFTCDYEARRSFPFASTDVSINTINEWMTIEGIVVFVKWVPCMHGMCLFEIKNQTFPCLWWHIWCWFIVDSSFKACCWVFGCMPVNMYSTLCLGLITINLNSHNIQHNIITFKILKIKKEHCHEILNLCVCKLYMWEGK